MQRDLIVIGASAGGLDALTVIVAALPLDLPACVVIVVHTRADSDGVLPAILARRSGLPVAFASDRLPLRNGHVFVAPPNRQLLVTREGLQLTYGPREHGFRPAVDPLFRTAARTYGRRVIGVILSGALDDGSHGLSVIKQQGGAAIVQDPDDAQIPNMPRNALRQTRVDAVLTAAAIGPALVELCRRPAARTGGRSMARTNEPEPQLPGNDTDVGDLQARLGPPSGLTCPDCGGALWEVKDGELVRYRCHVGHQFGADSLLSGQRDVVESALWAAVRVLEEHAELRERLARRAEAGGQTAVAAAFAEGARASHLQAQQLRNVLFAGGDEAPTAIVADAERRPSAPARRRGVRHAPRGGQSGAGAKAGRTRPGSPKKPSR